MCVLCVVRFNVVLVQRGRSAPCVAGLSKALILMGRSQGGGREEVKNAQGLQMLVIRPYPAQHTTLAPTHALPLLSHPRSSLATVEQRVVDDEREIHLGAIQDQGKRSDMKLRLLRNSPALSLALLLLLLLLLFFPPAIIACCLFAHHAHPEHL